MPNISADALLTAGLDSNGDFINAATGSSCGTIQSSTSKTTVVGSATPVSQLLSSPSGLPASSNAPPPVQSGNVASSAISGSAPAQSAVGSGAPNANNGTQQDEESGSPPSSASAVRTTSSAIPLTLHSSICLFVLLCLPCLSILSGFL